MDVVNGTKSLEIGIMFIQSKFKEFDQTLLDVHLPEGSCQYPSFIEKRTISLNNPYLKGEFTVFYTDGFCITKNNYAVKQKCTNLISAGENYIQLSLLITGESKIIKQTMVKDIQLGLLQLAHRKAINSQVEMPKSDKRLNYLRVFISKSFYTNLLSNEPWSRNDTFYTEVQKNRYVRFGSDVLPMNFAIAEIFSEIMENNYSGSMGQYFLQTKLKELFLTIHFNKSTQTVIHFVPALDLEKLQNAKAYLGTHYQNPPTIKQLSRIVSLNELKLKQGFKQVFETTVHAYTTELRMQHAKKMLNGNFPINEIAAAVGYKSSSYFISAYKKIYGITPKQSIN